MMVTPNKNAAEGSTVKEILRNKNDTLCMIGTWAWGSGPNGGKIVFGNHYNEQQLRDTFECAYNAGFTVWDTAEVYGMGSSERLLGSLIADKEVSISTKHFPYRHYRKGENRDAVNASLERLGREKIDIYWLHSPRNIEQNMKELAILQKEGLIERIGLSNGNLAQIRRAQITLEEFGTHLFAVQNHYSLLTIERENKILRYCQKNGIFFYGYMILEQGALSGHYDKDHRFPSMSLRAASFKKSKFKKIQPLIEYIRELAVKYETDSSRIPVAWAVYNGVIPILGITKPTHAENLLDGLEIELKSYEIKQLEKLALKSGVRCKGIWE